MAKKEEGRPITPEEYRELHYFNSRVESGLIKERKEITKQQQARIQAARAAVPDDAYDLPIMTLGLPAKVENLLNEAEFANVGELAYRMLLIPKSINDIEGIGPSYFRQIESALEVMTGYQPLPEEYDIEEDLLLEPASDEVEDSPDVEAEKEPAEGDSLEAGDDEDQEQESESGEGDQEELEEKETSPEEDEELDEDADLPLEAKGTHSGEDELEEDQQGEPEQVDEPDQDEED